MGCAGSKQGNEVFETLTFMQGYHGQLSPPQPGTSLSSHEDGTLSGPTVVRGGVRIQRGPFGSFWLRRASPGTRVAALLRVADELESANVRRTDGREFGIYLGLEEHLGGVHSIARRADFKFHHYRQKGHPTGNSSGDHAGPSSQHAEFIYYKWVGAHDAVPSYATAIEGVRGIFFSPPSSTQKPEEPGGAILLVWEHNCWRSPGGAVEPGELKTDTLAREISEEVGLQLDDGFRPRYLGGGQIVHARDAAISDEWSILAVRAQTTDFAVDQREVHHAAWFPWGALLDLWRQNGAPLTGKSALDAVLTDERFGHLRLEPKQVRFNNEVMTSLQLYEVGGGLDVYRMQSEAPNDGQHELVYGASREDAMSFDNFAFVKARGYPVTYVVDCGSQHTEVHVLRRGLKLGVEVHELTTRRLQHCDDDLAKRTTRSVSISRDVLRPMLDGAEAGLFSASTAVRPADVFAKALTTELSSLGRRAGDGSTVFLGATGGVRALVTQHGDRAQAMLEELRAALLPTLGGDVRFEVVADLHEALCEYEAARCIFGPLFAQHGMGTVGMLSGGGASCQFAWLPPLEPGTELAERSMRLKPTLLSVHLPSTYAENFLRGARGRRDDGAKSFHDLFGGAVADSADLNPTALAEHVHSHFAQALAAQQLPSLYGNFVGIASHEDCAQLGFVEEFLRPQQVIERIDTLVVDLLAQSGAGWERACAKWGEERAPNLWVIGAAGALRLKAILTQCFADSPESWLYFGVRAPGGKMDVSWPVGQKLLIDAAVAGRTSPGGGSTLTA